VTIERETSSLATQRVFGFLLIGRALELAAAVNAILDAERRRRVAR
jgi:hypothetical protein